MCANQLLHRQRIEKFIGDNKERAVLWKVIERGCKFDTGYLFGLQRAQRSALFNKNRRRLKTECARCPQGIGR